MARGHAYTFRVLRYIHDVMTAECMNVGLAYVVDGEPSRLLVIADARPIKAAFPDLDAGLLERDLAALAARSGQVFPDVLAFSNDLLADDDSSLQWGPVGSGIRAGTIVAEDLFKRLVPAGVRT